MWGENSYASRLNDPLTLDYYRQNCIVYEKRLFSCVERKSLTQGHNKKNFVWVTKKPCENCKAAFIYYFVNYQN